MKLPPRSNLAALAILPALAFLPGLAASQSSPAAQQPRPASAPASRAAPSPASTARPAQQGPGPAAGGLTLNAFLDQQGQAFSQIDADHNGIVSPQEFADHRARTDRERVVRQYQAMFTSLDVNRNAVLTGPEFMKLAASPQVRDTRLDFNALDTSRDGKLSRSEYLLRMTANFDRLDGNKDGTIDAAELAKGQQSTTGR